MSKKHTKIVAISGGFDPIHVGHIRMIKEAKKLGKLVVILNNDNRLKTKKGFVFMNQVERKEILLACGVDKVVITRHIKDDPDRSVCFELQMLKPDIFCNGGDRKGKKEVPETFLCQSLGIQMVFNVGGGKIQSSSWLTDNIKNK